MTVKHNYLFINLLFLLITGCLYDNDMEETKKKDVLVHKINIKTS